MAQLAKHLLDHGVLVKPHWNPAMTNPPLPITEEELAEGFAILDWALEITDRAVTGQRSPTAAEKGFPATRGGYG